MITTQLYTRTSLPSLPLLSPVFTRAPFHSIGGLHLPRQLQSANAGSTETNAEDAVAAADRAALSMMQYTVRGQGDHAKVRVKKYVSRAKRQNLQVSL